MSILIMAEDFLKQNDSRFYTHETWCSCPDLVRVDPHIRKLMMVPLRITAHWLPHNKGEVVVGEGKTVTNVEVGDEREESLEGNINLYG